MKRTIIDLFETAVDTYSGNVFLKEKIGREWQETTYSQIRENVYRFGAGLVSLGVKKGDMASLLSEGRNAWIEGELALFYAGAVNVPLSVKLDHSSDLLFRLIHSDSQYILVSATQLPKIRTIKEQLPNIKYIIIFDDMESYEEREISMSEVCKMGESYLADNREEFLKISQSIQNDDIATITYTSGTTADPKGVMLTHRNYTANVEQSLTLMDIPQTYKTLIILPLDHCFAHVVGFYIFLNQGASVATVQQGSTPIESLKNIPININEIKPNLILSVPALAKTFKKSIESSIRSKGKFTEWLFRTALKTSILYNRDGWSRGKGWVAILKPLVALFDKIIYSKVRAGMGGEIDLFVGGGALLSVELQDFYYAIGMPMFQGYGLSEATPVISSNAQHRHKFGTSGTLVKPLEIKILDAEGEELPQGEKGEIVVRGENVMAGYWKNEESTADTIKDGWLHTGDMGYMDKDDFLVVLGRFKSLLIGSDGEKYSPEGIEEALVGSSTYIDQIVLHNNQDPYTTAIIVPNIDALKGDVSATWGSNEAQHEAIKLIQGAINEYKKGGAFAGTFPERWLPASFALLDTPFTEQNQMVNSSLKIVRNKVEECYADRIKAMYGDKKDIFNDDNLKVVKNRPNA
ncbi:MAG: AMP-binding protein [Rikenellaceae bacterium]